MKYKNYYEILEISQSASYSDIKRAYYSLCKRYHPDVNPNSANLFKNINEAYDILINPVTRKEYDNLLSNGYEEINDNIYSKDYDHDKYYNYSRYYQDPSKESVIDILKYFNEYRFENAIKAIWKRNIFVIYGNTIFCIIISFGTLFNRIAKLFKKSIIPLKLYNYKHTKSIFYSIKENTLFRFINWSIIMMGISIFKTISAIFKSILFVYTRILKPLFLPIGIILASLIHSRR